MVEVGRLVNHSLFFGAANGWSGGQRGGTQRLCVEAELEELGEMSLVGRPRESLSRRACYAKDTLLSHYACYHRPAPWGKRVQYL